MFDHLTGIDFVIGKVFKGLVWSQLFDNGHCTTQLQMYNQYSLSNIDHIPGQHFHVWINANGNHHITHNYWHDGGLPINLVTTWELPPQALHPLDRQVFEATGNVVGAKDGAPAQAPPQQLLNMIQQIQQAAQNLATPGNNVAQAIVPMQATQVQNVALPMPVAQVQNNAANAPVAQVPNAMQPMPVPIPGLPGFVLPMGINAQIPGMLTQLAIQNAHHFPESLPLSIVNHAHYHPGKSLCKCLSAELAEALQQYVQGIANANPQPQVPNPAGTPAAVAPPIANPMQVAPVQNLDPIPEPHQNVQNHPPIDNHETHNNEAPAEAKDQPPADPTIVDVDQISGNLPNSVTY
jgi:hypothetical protein